MSQEEKALAATKEVSKAEAFETEYEYMTLETEKQEFAMSTYMYKTQEMENTVQYEDQEEEVEEEEKEIRNGSTRNYYIVSSEQMKRTEIESEVRYETESMATTQPAFMMMTVARSSSHEMETEWKNQSDKSTIEEMRSEFQVRVFLSCRSNSSSSNSSCCNRNMNGSSSNSSNKLPPNV